MICPECGGKLTVVDVRHNAEDNEDYRKRKCMRCGKAMYSIEFPVEYDVDYDKAYKKAWQGRQFAGECVEHIPMPEITIPEYLTRGDRK